MDYALQAPTVNPLQARVDELTQQLTNARAAHIRDVNAIGDKLKELAEEHGWCSTYDAAVDEINGQLTVKLPTRLWTYTATVTFVVKIDGQPDDEAAEEAADAWGRRVYETMDRDGVVCGRFEVSEVEQTD